MFPLGKRREQIMADNEFWAYTAIGTKKHLFASNESERTYCGLSAKWNGPWFTHKTELAALTKCKHCVARKEDEDAKA